MMITVYGDQAEELAEKAKKEVQRLDSLLSTGNPESEVGKINAGGGGVLSEDGQYLMKRSLELWKETDGAFDLTVYPLMELWGFTDSSFKVPSDDDLKKALTLVGSDMVKFDEATGETAFAIEGMKIDFGGIAKGYASSQVVSLLREAGAEHAMVNLGGNVQALGGKPDGSDWRIGVRMPDGTNDIMCVLSIRDCAVITSGGYERFFEEGGKTYHHILDPKTGRPADNSLLSVTVVSEDGTSADALATALFIMGEEKAEEYWREHRTEFNLILAMADGSVKVTEGIAERCKTELPLTVIRADAK
ncbi:MAG: FAD:protein FMN transferase [Lachnospiraceae bacterium]|nr:FAD:protein FMN transferase [Lachnospiraceae bacterium]